jgi:outer membrane receptor protein involved in Fe transport
MARTMLVGRYVSSYLDPSAFDTGPRAGTYQELGDFWMFDLNLELSLGRVFRNRPILSGTSLNIGATNLFNRLPDFCNSCFVGYDASQYDIVGRTVYAELRVNF